MQIAIVLFAAAPALALPTDPDGASTVPVGYTLQGMKVEPYKKEKAEEK